MQKPIALSLYDSYLKREFHLLSSDSTVPGTLKMYSCGPTVYNYQSIGNMRAVWLPDTIALVAKLAGWKVQWTLNITDVGHLVGDGDQGEDKIESAAKKEHRSVESIVQHYTDDYRAQCAALHFSIPNGFYNPKATDYIEEQMLLSVQLMKDGLAYCIDDGIYFDYASFAARFSAKATGALRSILERDVRNSGDRNFTDRKILGGAKHPYDFAVWKFVDPRSLQQWKFLDYQNVMNLLKEARVKDMSIFTKAGCPGWHSECVCMIIGTLANETTARHQLSSDYYTQFRLPSSVIDIHFGGEDHIDIHHKNEVLQSAALGIHLAQFWVHNKFVMVDGQKMSKSLGNVYQVIGKESVTGFPSISEKGYDPLVYRLMLFEHMYSEQLNFTWEKLQSTQKRLANLRKLGSAIISFALAKDIRSTDYDYSKDGLIAHLTNNLNTPLFLEDYTKVLTRIVDTITKFGVLTIEDLNRALFWDTQLLKLDLFFTPDTSVSSLIEARAQAKSLKNFEEADRLRGQIYTQNVDIDDYNWGSGVRKRA